MSQKRTSLQRFRLKKLLSTLSSKEGRGTELVSLYVPEGRQVSEVLAMLKQEHGTASNIKSDITRKNVQDAITKVSQRLRLFKRIPENGLVIFSGAIPQNGGPGSEKLETYVLNPPEPIDLYLYRCDARFHTEHLNDLLKAKEIFGVIVLDSSGATFVTLQGSRLIKVQEITSGIPGKHRAGGQSAARFSRLRETKVLDFYKRVANHANEIFLQIPDLKGIIIGGPGPTKQDFEKAGYLHYSLKDKIVATIDTAYISDQGIKEIIDRAPQIIKQVRYVEEKRLIQDFLYEIGHDTGLVTYGEKEVRRSLEAGAVKTLLLSEELDFLRLKIECSSCKFLEQKTLLKKRLEDFQQEIETLNCPNCSSLNLQIETSVDLIDDLIELAEQSGSDIEIISSGTEDGAMLKESFGGIAAILRYKL
jgi:peptide chain release factor subunit 1